MNFRNIALVAALVSVAGVASAQSFELKANTGCTVVGNVITVAPGPSSFSVDVWFNAAAAGTATGSTMVLSVAYDSTNTTSGTPVPTGPLTAGAPADNTQWSSDVLSRYTGQITSGLTTARLGQTPGTGNNLQGSGLRSVVWYIARSGGNNSSITGSMKVATFTFNSAIANGDTWGDSAAESGLYVYQGNNTATSVSGGSSGLSGVGNYGSQKYQVTAVPEPATMTALGLGLAAIARRRRSSKK